MREHYPEITRKLEPGSKPSDDDLEALRAAIEDFIKKHVEAK